MKTNIKDYFDQPSLNALFNTSMIEKSSVGVDGITNKKFSSDLDQEIEIINRKISNDTYNFSLYKEKLILKGRDSKPRGISIPTNRDKLVLKTLHNYLKKQYEGALNDESIHQKIADIKYHINANNYDSYIKLDIENFYPSISHEILKSTLIKTISDPNALQLIDKAIKQSTVSLSERGTEKYLNTRGVPQGLSISGLLSSIFLSHIDSKHTDRPHYQYYRFVDDILILCNSTDIDKISAEIVSDMVKIDLTVHPFTADSLKSSYGSISEGFQYLGYIFKGNQISVRESSLDKIYRGINNVFLQHNKYTREKDFSKLYYRLNLKITGCVVDDKQYGWLFFFSYINDQTLLFKLDAHVKRACKRFCVPYSSAEIKKFSRTYYELSKMDKSNYIPHYSNKELAFSLIADIQSDIEYY